MPEERRLCRILDRQGHPLCLSCGRLTNNAYRGHFAELPCWNCGQPLSYDSFALHDAFVLKDNYEIIVVSPLEKAGEE